MGEYVIEPKFIHVYNYNVGSLFEFSISYYDNDGIF